MFLVLVAFIAVFAIVVMVHVPRKGIAMEVPAPADAALVAQQVVPTIASHYG